MLSSDCEKEGYNQYASTATALPSRSARPAAASDLHFSIHRHHFLRPGRLTDTPLCVTARHETHELPPATTCGTTSRQVPAVNTNLQYPICKCTLDHRPCSSRSQLRALSRDSLVPGSRWLCRLYKSSRTPAYGMLRDPKCHWNQVLYFLYSICTCCTVSAMGCSCCSAANIRAAGP